VVAVAMWAALAVAPAAAGAAVGDLTGAGCVQDVRMVVVCDAQQHGLDAVSSVAVSPDGRSLYATSGGDGAIVAFGRDAAGALAPAGCIEDVGRTGCGAEQQGLGGTQGAHGLAAAADGRAVFVASIVDHALVAFDRAASGELGGGVCIQDVGLSDCASSAQGLDGAYGISSRGFQPVVAGAGQNPSVPGDARGNVG
ncbi:MAG TPA: hypothetical protein VHG93_28595, partial [Longimicrobium sp.]|nr:hypothetical protein [Longimicrobium sp.]